MCSFLNRNSLRFLTPSSEAHVEITELRAGEQAPSISCILLVGVSDNNVQILSSVNLRAHSAAPCDSAVWRSQNGATAIPLLLR